MKKIRGESSVRFWNFSKRGQVTLFIILAIVIVVFSVTFYFFKSDVLKPGLPASIQPVDTQFVQCLEDSVLAGVHFAESNGGYIKNPNFIPGNRYNPSSSTLSFGGLEIPYWSYSSSSGLPTEQIPSSKLIQEQLQDFVNDKIKDCNFDEFRDAGYKIKTGEPDVRIEVSDDFVDVKMLMDFSVEKGSDISLLNKHELRVNSNFGLLMNNAKSIYKKQKEEMFLENYGVDVLRLYLPVDGVELTCSPLTWNVKTLYNELKDALENNVLSITNQGKDDDYFVLDLNKEVKTNFIYFSDWPTYFEVNPSNSGTMISKPIGNQKGMGMLGFCYVPYHYVYNINYPVLIQISKDGETFQFPVVSVIKGNLPREARTGDNSIVDTVDVCEYKNTEMKVDIYDADLNPIEGTVNFECFGSYCDIGKTTNGEIIADFPQCANGIIDISAEGYRDKQIVYSTINSGSIVTILDKEYSRPISLDFDGRYMGNAIISFSNKDYSTNIVYPETKNVSLSLGDYNVSVYLYSDSEITIPASEKEQCFSVPRNGILGLAGLTSEQCTTIQFPEETLSSALIGGGSASVHFSEKGLKDAKTIKIKGDKLTAPASLLEIQKNYILVDTKILGVTLE